ncbi:hypothetical protein [Streptomyces chryseus]|uniref:Secreted protein n=1 Tax=Streptomyces chryseus TaxID=68186 RepID=A0ABQ3DI78_9ACTN|nr:hypothetical protein [Streptomyces chryseus]GGX13414.1 hypothetical protein GCM10010353_30810 [Streptomyces chryseus]GHA97932.1 hypothetical protein GCM10010346_21060 [Streptomyces chryseus]
MPRTRRAYARALALALALVVPAVLPSGVVRAEEIPKAPGHRLVSAYEGEPATARPVPGEAPPQHPFLAPNGRSGMHADAAGSGTHPYPGPLGRDPQVTSERIAALGGECATATFDAAGRLITVCGTFQGFRLKLLHPRTLATLAEYKLPQRSSTVEAVTRLDFEKIFKDTSGGAYFYLDNEDRVVLADSRQHVLRIAHERTADGSWRFVVEDDWDLTAHVPHDCVTWTNLNPSGTCDPVTSVMPDWQGRVWWVTRLGRVGTVDPRTSAIRAIRLAGEEIQNSFSVAEDGVSIVSDHALYSFRADPDGTPRVQWRQTYDRGTGTKPGSVNQGSGTTPDLFGDGYVAITDNADDRMNVLVYRRGTNVPGNDRLVCEVPVFTSGRSTTDNSLISWGNSLVVENNYGYENPSSLLLGRSVTGGATRIDVRENGSGCDTVWESDVRSPSTVPKLSTANGLLYFYAKEPNRLGIDAWYLTAVDFRTGKIRWRQLTGTGPAYDNNWAPLTIGPDGTAYAGVFNGIVAVRDRD